MSAAYQNLCTRCGKVRIVVRTWEEEVGYSVVTNTEMACPDPACQKVVDEENRKQANKYRLLKKKSEERMKERYANALKKRRKIKKES